MKPTSQELDKLCNTTPHGGSGVDLAIPPPTPEQAKLWAQWDKDLEPYRLKATHHAQSYGMKPSLFARLFGRVGSKRKGWSGRRED